MAPCCSYNGQNSAFLCTLCSVGANSNSGVIHLNKSFNSTITSHVTDVSGGESTCIATSEPTVQMQPVFFSSIPVIPVILIGWLI